MQKRDAALARDWALNIQKVLRQNLRGYGPLTSKNLPFRRAKMVVACTSAGESTGQSTIGEVLLLKKGEKATDKTVSQGDLWHPPPQKFSEVTSVSKMLFKAIE